MDKFFDKISQYDLFVNLIPGYVLYYFLLNSGYELKLGDALDKLIFCYVSGILISRLASVIVEPACKCLGVVKFATYEDYITASREDDKIAILSGINNLYRNFVATGAIIAIVLMIQDYFKRLPCNIVCIHIIAIVLIMGLLIISYRKQTSYVRRRVEHAIRNQHD